MGSAVQTNPFLSPLTLSTGALSLTGSGVCSLLLLSSGGKLLSSGGRLLSSGGKLLSSGGRLLSSGGKLLSSGGRLLSSLGMLLSSTGVLDSSEDSTDVSDEDGVGSEVGVTLEVPGSVDGVEGETELLVAGSQLARSKPAQAKMASRFFLFICSFLRVRAYPAKNLFHAKRVLLRSLMPILFLRKRFLQSIF